MSYTATLTEREYKRGKWLFSILYIDTDTSESFERNYRRTSITKKEMRDLARREALAFIVNEVSDIDIPIGTTIDVTPDPVVEPDPPTQAEIDHDAWFDDYHKLNRMLAVVSSIPALGTTQNNTAIEDLRATLEAGWLNRYLGDI